MTKIEFAKSFGLKRTSLVDIIKELELKGKSKKRYPSTTTKR